MKNNQYAIQHLSFEEEIAELKKINYLEKELDEYGNSAQLWQALLEKTFPEARTVAVKRAKLKGLRANATKDVTEYLKTQEEVEVEAFYNVALQLLGFLDEVDFAIDKAVLGAKKIQLPVLEPAGGLFTKESLVRAWYLLLTTHTKFGLSFIDSLASKGYFKEISKNEVLFFNGKTMPTFEPSAFIREVVYVETDLDTDEDGSLDLVKVEIVRPSTSEEVPSLFTASPYNQGTNPEANDKKLHDVNVPLTRKTPNQTTYEEIQFHRSEKVFPAKREVAGVSNEAEETFTREQSYSLNDFFLTRGFAAVYSAGIGTSDSDGIQTCGSVEQTDSMKAVVEWLAGNRRAFTNRTDTIEIKATWSNGLVAMTGKSYLGTLATAVATTGVEGLATVISEAAISDWYQYYRDNGLVIAPGGFPGEDADVLAELTYSRMLQAGDWLHSGEFFNQKQAEMAKLQDRTTGNYNTFWDERNYLPNVKNIKADMILVHGLNDWNVKPRHVERLWNKLREVEVSKKVFLHQGQHIYINNNRSLDFSDMMNLWLSYKLYGLENGADELLPSVVWQDNSEPETWRAFTDWSKEVGMEREYYFSNQLLTETPQLGAQSFCDKISEELFEKYTKDFNLWNQEIKNPHNEELEGTRLLFQTEELNETLILDGVPTVKVKVASSQDIGMLSFQLVDYGKSKCLGEVPQTLEIKAIDRGCDWRPEDLREFQYGKETPYKMITKGHVNLQNRENPWRNEELVAGEFVEVEVELQPTLYKLSKGRKLGLLIYATDYEMTIRGNQELTYTVDFSGSKVTIPVKEVVIL
ncbi:MAG: Xaa-Pro dipeptidyl-peptidase [Lactobacillales bacterium]|jgi:X-Pro dipeptidyl-peptidase|nr:Xaa-Pro dipeptidyl-peptidase [Lactobacillales bacterium]